MSDRIPAAALGTAIPHEAAKGRTWMDNMRVWGVQQRIPTVGDFEEEGRMARCPHAS